MKIRITALLPVERDIVPAVGSVHDVVDTNRAGWSTLHYIILGGVRVGVFCPQECEVIADEG